MPDRPVYFNTQGQRTSNAQIAAEMGISASMAFEDIWDLKWWTEVIARHLFSDDWPARAKFSRNGVIYDPEATAGQPLYCPSEYR